MSMPPLKLASRPFRNERLPALLLALGFVAMAALTFQHAVWVRDLMPGRTSTLARQVAALEAEEGRLREEAARLRAPRPDAGSVAQWALLKELVDRRTFSWSGLFAVLEESLPPGIRLASITPHVKDGQMTVDLTARARSNDDVLELIRVLEEREEFADVLPRSRTGLQEMEVRFTMAYRPRPMPAAVPAAAAMQPAAAAAAPEESSPEPGIDEVPAGRASPPAPAGNAPAAVPPARPATPRAPTRAPE